jgi:intracellular multiplication protein IcmV
MKKKSNSRVVGVFSRIFNVRTWSDWERMKSFTFFVGHGFRSLFLFDRETTPDNEKPALTESFTAAQEQLKLTDADLLNRQKALLRLSIFMTVLALFIVTYSVYHFYYGAYRAGLLSLVVMMISIALAFRYHFWYYQIKSRKLGCTVGEWFRNGLLGEKE